MFQKQHFPSGIVWVSVTASIATASCLVLAAVMLNGGPSENDIAAGESLFRHEFEVNDPLCGEGDGLGPVFNEKSCAACHFLGGTGGAGPNSKNVTSFEAFPVPGRPTTASGGVHSFAIAKTNRESTGMLSDLFPSVPFSTRSEGGMCAEVGSMQTRFFDPVQIEEINTPALFGLGQIEKISSAALTLQSTKRSFGKIGRELEGNFEGTGIGRLRTLGSAGIGKFGWKGQFATVEEFVANACAMELGLTNHLAAQTIPKEFVADTAASPDMTRQQLYELVSYVKSLPAPQQVVPTDPVKARMVHHGQELFNSIGCADCHVADIGGVQGVYSDFQLYEVEDDDVADDYVEPDFDPAFTLPFAHPRPAEWKTPPLWGVADSAPYFHDGKSPHLTAAIMRHGRDGRFSRDKFEDLDKSDKRSVIAFLESLRAPEVGRDVAR